MQWSHVNFAPEDLCCHGNQPFIIKDKIGCRLTRASNVETQLLGYIAWQWDRYLVPQNVFLVQGALADPIIKPQRKTYKSDTLLLDHLHLQLYAGKSRRNVYT